MPSPAAAVMGGNTGNFPFWSASLGVGMRCRLVEIERALAEGHREILRAARTRAGVPGSSVSAAAKLWVRVLGGAAPGGCPLDSHELIVRIHALLHWAVCGGQVRSAQRRQRSSEKVREAQRGPEKLR